jgi:cell wall assembly regulator SMI1
MMDRDIESLWRRIQAWHDVNAAGSEFALAPGVTDVEIEAAEAMLGVRLPDDVVHRTGSPTEPAMRFYSPGGRY